MARPYFGGTTIGVRDVTSSATLGMADSGKTIILDGSGVEDAALLVTLPAVSNKGCEYSFILKAIGNEAAEDVDIVQASASDDFVGFIVSASDPVAIASANASDTRIRFDQSAGAAAGDWCHVISDGSKWHIFGVCSSQDTSGDSVLKFVDS
tara:strand:+ start:26 stop:481 length:456 start_codon:yes stop_codon:yes gene_type:complete